MLGSRRGMSRRTGMHNRPAYPLAGFSDTTLGTRRFDYDFDASRITTHMPDAFTRITANSGIAGATLNGAPSNLEPYLVTQNGYPAMNAPTTADAIDQSLLASDAASNYIYMHDSSVKNIYILTRTPTASTDCHLLDTELYTTATAGLRIRRRSSGFGGAIGIVVADDSGSPIVADNIGAGDSPDNTNMLVGIHCDGTDWRCTINGIVKATWTPSGAHGTGNPGQALRVGASSGSATHVYDGHIFRFSCYTGSDHISGGILQKVYDLVKVTYPSLGLA